MITVLAITWSIGGLLWLSATDPKRRRSQGLPAAPAPALSRRLIWWALLAPGLLFIASGTGGAFVLWLGACSALGWFLVAQPAGRFATFVARIKK